MRFRGSASSREVVESMTDIEFMGIVQSIHGELVESLEWATATGCPEQCAKELPQLIQKICQVRGSDLSLGLQSAVADAVLAESIGLGPLEPLLSDPQITDILVNSFDEVFVEREGKLSRANIQFVDNAHVMRIIQRIAARVGRRLDEGSPVVDARMDDGSRVHAVVPPLAVRGPTISIRRFSSSPLLLDQLVRGHSLDSKMASFLAAVVASRVSCLISGGTGAGKTTLLNALSACIPSDERIVTIEDVTELRLVHPHIVSLEARNSNVDGRGEISIRELARNSLRMRPDRIIVGEVRGNEAIDMLQALNTGHEGSMTTIHANDTGDALARLELLVGMAGYDFTRSFSLEGGMVTLIKSLSCTTRPLGRSILATMKTCGFGAAGGGWMATGRTALFFHAYTPANPARIAKNKINKKPGLARFTNLSPLPVRPKRVHAYPSLQPPPSPSTYPTEYS